MDILLNAIGIAGTLLFLSAYALLQRDVLSAHDPRYLWMNLGGSLMVIVSLLWAWNLPSFLLECTWAVISIYGLFTVHKKRAA